MIAFSEASLETEIRLQPLVLTFGTPMTNAASVSFSEENKESTSASQGIDAETCAKAAKAQQELAMLQSALAHCGLVRNEQNNQE